MISRTKFHNRRAYPPISAISTTVLNICLIMLLSANVVSATVATEQETNRVCHNWLTQIIHEKGTWAQSSAPYVDGVQDLIHEGMLLARCYSIKPRGFILVPVIKEMQPIKAYSDESNLNLTEDAGFVQMVREVLYGRMQSFENLTGSLEKSHGDDPAITFGRSQRELWDIYTLPVDEFGSTLTDQMLLEEAGPMLVSSWHQRAPYNNYCPHDGIDRCVVGCTATAMAQLLKFWQWPVNGNGSHSYTWYNTRCGNSGPAQVLSADFSDEYDWANIVDSCDEGCTPEQEAALAELNYEVGVAINMNYGSCGSAASYSSYALINYFRYSPLVYREDRADHDLGSWFSIIRQEIDDGRPLLYSINMHSIVCDGYRDHGEGQYEYHMNYGWGNEFTAWYRLDTLYCGWIPGEVCPADQDGLMANIEPQSTPYLWIVNYSVDDSDGDGDGHAEIDETVSLTFTIANMGMEASGVSGTLSSDDINIDITSPTNTFAGPIPWDGQSVNETPFEFTVNPGCPDPHIVRFEIAISSDGGYVALDTLQIYIGNTVGFADDMESGEGYWHHTILTPGFKEQWHHDSYCVHSGSVSWKAGKSGELNYSDYQDACLMTPPFLLPSDAELTFWHWIDAEIGDPGTAWDGGVVMMSLQDGQWFQIFPEGGYPYTIIDNAANPLPGGMPCYSGAHGWSREVFDLSMSSGVAQIMFRFGVDGAVNEEGWYIDDVEIKRSYVCGDANNDGGINIGDVVYIGNHVFRASECVTNPPIGCPPDPYNSGDVNCDESVNIGDAVYLGNVIFRPGSLDPCASCL